MNGQQWATTLFQQNSGVHKFCVLTYLTFQGFLESLDDFYLLGSQMVMLQTTNSVFNMSLYDLVTPDSILSWQRVRVSNMMAHDGQEWARVLSQHNSGGVSLIKREYFHLQQLFH